MEFLHPIFKWFHIFAGIIWIGLLYFFNFVNGPLMGTLDGDTKKKVAPELLPRALYWFRWGAAWTWVTGVVLLYVVFWAGGNMYEADIDVTPISHSMILFSFVAVFLYDFLYKSSLATNTRLITIVSFILVGLTIFVMGHYGQFSYRAYNIHIGTMFGTMMAFNVWFRIWPAQQKIITAVKNGEAPESGLVALAGLRSKHNTYLSLPLIWTIINQHTVPFNGIFGLHQGTELLIVVALGWHIIFQCYKKAAKVQGF